MESALKTYRSPTIIGLDFSGYDNKEIVPVIVAAAAALAGYAAARAVTNAIGVSGVYFMRKLNKVEQRHDKK